MIRLPDAFPGQDQDPSNETIVARHGSMTKKLREQKALKHDQYPETLNGATEAMNAHAIDAGHYEAVRKDKESASLKLKSSERSLIT